MNRRQLLSAILNSEINREDVSTIFKTIDLPEGVYESVKEYPSEVEILDTDLFVHGLTWGGESPKGKPLTFKVLKQCQKPDESIGQLSFEDGKRIIFISK